MRNLSLALGVLACLVGASRAQSGYVETFEHGNVGQWTWLGLGTPQVQPAGGNPGAYLTKVFQQSAGAALKHLAEESPFVGDYRARGVRQIGVDLATFLTQENLAHPDFHMTLGLANDAGTPLDPNDDSIYYLETSLKPPMVGEGWKSYQFDVPSQVTGTPPGWSFYDNPVLPPIADPMTWDEVITDVSYLWILNGDPLGFYIISNWNVGADNVRIAFDQAAVSYCTAGTSASGCQATLSASGSPSASAASGFVLEASTVEGQKAGLYFLGTSGRQASPWGNGTSFQCVAPPLQRLGLMSGVGTAGACDGGFSLDLNALWCPACPSPGKNPGAGAQAQAQLWYRDPLSTSNQSTSLSDALQFFVAP
jgi:hypothetical protein